LHPLNAALDSKPREQAAEMRLHRALFHLQLSGYLWIVTPLQQQVGDPLLASTESAKTLFHGVFPRREVS